MQRKKKHEMGAGGRCVCPNCETYQPHRRGVPCQDERCPTCGGKMLREGSTHHEQFVKKQEKSSEQGA